MTRPFPLYHFIALFTRRPREIQDSYKPSSLTTHFPLIKKKPSPHLSYIFTRGNKYPQRTITHIHFLFQLTFIIPPQLLVHSSPRFIRLLFKHPFPPPTRRQLALCLRALLSPRYIFARARVRDFASRRILWQRYLFLLPPGA